MTRATYHAKKRSKQRHQPMSRAQLAKYAAMIASKDPAAVMIRPANGRTELWAVPHAGAMAPVIFSPDTGMIVTVLPLHTLPVRMQYPAE